MRRPTDVHVYMPTRTEYITQTIKVEERRAPTDESVRLLKEFEEEARKKIESSINVGGNGFECTIMTEREHITDDIIAVASSGRLLGEAERPSRVVAPQVENDMPAIADGLHRIVLDKCVDEFAKPLDLKHGLVVLACRNRVISERERHAGRSHAALDATSRRAMPIHVAVAFGLEDVCRAHGSGLSRSIVAVLIVVDFVALEICRLPCLDVL